MPYKLLVVNYFVAFLVGLFFLDSSIVPTEIINEDWFKGSILLGFVFIYLLRYYANFATKRTFGGFSGF